MRSAADLGSPHPEQFLTVDALPRGDSHVVLDVVGSVDASTAPLLHACLRTQVSRPGLRELVVDFGGVELLDEAGVSAVVEAARRCRERGLRFRLRAPGRKHVLRSLEVAAMRDGLHVEPDTAAPLPLTGSVTRA